YRLRAEKALHGLAKRQHRGIITVDSGAHSFFHAEGLTFKGKMKQDPGDPLDFFEGYIDWIKAHFHLIDYFVELDLQELVGQDRLLGWREEMKRAGIFGKCITVHHTCNTEKDWQELLEGSESAYVAVEGLRPGVTPLPYGTLLRDAYRQQIRVHAFALIQPQYLHRYPFYSADSAS